jgi:sulfopyruvate decarboxylase beta subunit
VRYPEEELIAILRRTGVDFTASLPCEKIKVLLEMIEDEFGRSPLHHIPLTREEEGVGICAGASLAGKRPAIFVQSSGIGNMINALLSLTGFYELPLAIFVSQRGVHKEKIEAQMPMGRRLPQMLKGAGIAHSTISSRRDFPKIERILGGLYKRSRIHAFLLSPAIWEASHAPSRGPRPGSRRKVPGTRPSLHRVAAPRLVRYELLEAAVPFLSNKAVVCNLGLPAKELFEIRHQESNFYMLGSMGMATPVGLGISVATKKEVVVIDGDGSLLMNPGTLATVAYLKPKNLTILAMDNAAYGSTGSQPTLAGSCVDLEAVARGFGIRNTTKVSTKRQLTDALKNSGRGPLFIHALAVPGNRGVPNITLHHLENKKQVRHFLLDL